MKTTEQRVSEYTHTVITGIICDICKLRRSDDDWATSTYEVNEIEIKHEYGQSYPEGGNKTIVQYDLCPDCFSNKLMPWLKSQGATPQIDEIDW